jgi:hypothetical protein
MASSVNVEEIGEMGNEIYAKSMYERIGESGGGRGAEAVADSGEAAVNETTAVRIAGESRGATTVAIVNTTSGGSAGLYIYVFLLRTEIFCD